MEIRLLGPLEVHDDHGQQALPRGQRPLAVLAALALQPNQPVPVPQLVHALWGTQPPPTARQAIHVFVHHLREALGPGVICTCDTGYLLQVAPEQTDVVRFKRLADQAYTAHARGWLQVAWEEFGQALTLWRGMALAGLTNAPFAEVERTRLTEQRHAALEAQLQVGLALGRHTELVGELEALVSEHPLRETLWELLMLARYRAGRQAEALATYQAARTKLVAQGLEPGDRLQHLERAILSHDPTLDLPGQQLPPAPQPIRLPPTAIHPPPPLTTRPVATAPPGTRAVVREERKTVTVMVASNLSLPGDPEDVRAQVAEATRQASQLVGRYGGVVQAEAMGRLLVAFGAQQSHEDDPERAVRAALELCAEVKIAGEPLRIGVATGQVVVTHAQPSDQAPDTERISVVGEVLDTAMSLAASANPGSVLVEGRTYWATNRAITYRPVTQGTIPSWEAVAPQARTGAFTTPTHRTTPLVEREREVSILADVLSRFRHDRQPQLLTVVSEPGLGKTRLVAELGRMVDQAPELITWRVGHSFAYGSGSLGALAEIVKAHAGILGTDPPESIRHKLGQAVTHTIADAGEAARVTDALGALIDPTPATDTAALPRKLTVAWARFLAASATSRPMVVVFEDLHWADEVLLEFVDSLIDQVGPVPLLVVGTARLELLQRRASWGGGQRNAATISLSPLSPQGSLQLLAALLDDVQIPEGTRQMLLATAGGNPLFVEEYVRVLTQEGAGALVGTEAGPVPATVRQLIAARLDTLQLGDKQLLQDLAVLGEVGWAGALAAISGQDRDQVQERLRRLERGEFLRRLRASSIAGETEYAFRHPLIREVAYTQLLRTQRAHKHRQAADWLQTLNLEPTSERGELLAYHHRALTATHSR